MRRTGLLRVLGCVTNATAVHLFGFNWSDKHYFTHQMSVRRQCIYFLLKRGHSDACVGGLPAFRCTYLH